MGFQGQIHASCAARGEAAVLLLGPAGSGKSDLVLRLLDCGFALVADDRVDIADGFAGPPAELAGLLEVRGVGIVRLDHVAPVRLVLAVSLDGVGERLPEPTRHPLFDVPLITLDAATVSAAQKIALALSCALGECEQVAGAFAP